MLEGGAQVGADDPEAGLGPIDRGLSALAVELAGGMADLPAERTAVGGSLAVLPSSVCTTRPILAEI